MKNYVICISNLGSTYLGKVLNKDFKDLTKQEKIFFKNCAGIDRYALVLDVEYNYFSIKKWGYDCFTFEQYEKRYGKENFKYFLKMFEGNL